MAQKPVLIYNPTAGKGSAGKRLAQVRSLLQARGFDYDLALTQGAGHACEISQRAAEQGCPLVIAAGGDGTINETINGLMLVTPNGHPRPALAVLPIGTGNDFAFGMNIPHDLTLACDTLIQNRRKWIDIGHVMGGDDPRGRYFGNGIGLGFDTVVGLEAAKIGWLQGAGSYLVGVVRAIFLYAVPPTYEIVFDGQTRRQPFLMISVMNGRRMGGSFLMAPTSDASDGVFDLCLAGHVKQISIPGAALQFIRGTQASHPQVEMARARQIHVRAIHGSIPAHADGETICTAGQWLAVEIFPGALEVLSN